MKKFTYIFVIIGFLMGSSLIAQVVPNGDFEEWEDNGTGGMQPVGWLALLNSAAFSNVNEVPGYGGGSAAELLATEFPGIGVISPSLVSNTFPVNQNYAKMNGYVKGTPVGNDTLYILAAMLSEETIVGAGVAYVTQQINEFTEFEVNITYDVKAQADSCFISLIAGQISDSLIGATEGTSFTVDELSLSGNVDIQELSPAFAEIGQPFPSPANDYITLPFNLNEPNEISIQVFDITGKIVHNKPPRVYYTGRNEIRIETSNLITGTYFISIIPSDGILTTRKFMVK